MTSERTAPADITGDITDERRQEFILWSDTLGLSMLVDALAKVHMIVRAPGYRTLATHIFDRESEYLGSYAVFAVKPSLLREFLLRQADDPERPDGVEGDWFSVENTVVLAPV